MLKIIYITLMKLEKNDIEFILLFVFVFHNFTLIKMIQELSME